MHRSSFLALLAVTSACLCEGRFEGRARQSEAKTNLRFMNTAAKALWAEQDRYSADLRELGFTPERGNRYTYFAHEEGPLERRTTETIATSTSPVSVIGADLFKHPKALAVDRFRDTGCPPPSGRYPSGEPVRIGVFGVPPEQHFVGYAVGNIDGDKTPDCWSVATFERVSATGEPIPAGAPYNEVNDREN